MQVNKVHLYNRVVVNDQNDATVYHVLKIEGHNVFIQQVGDDNKPIGKGSWIDCCYLQEPTHQQFLNYARSQK